MFTDILPPSAYDPSTLGNLPPPGAYHPGIFPRSVFTSTLPVHASSRMQAPMLPPFFAAPPPPFAAPSTSFAHPPHSSFFPPPPAAMSTSSPEINLSRICGWHDEMDGRFIECTAHIAGSSKGRLFEAFKAHLEGAHGIVHQQSMYHTCHVRKMNGEPCLERRVKMAEHILKMHKDS
ncbi:hypothetical protein BD626DRAFT_504005 [Schizophyllum amplum]|uniref:Uncharacterized protein n=1 Tax=Schizophyllum amplum TaxID=97359 RepID=A0A550C7P1_9AGAR|nr:hypothetical protein BD626DRAFT_504005 [Auriculariopsis ampla]